MDTGDPGGKGKTGTDVLVFEIRIINEDFLGFGGAVRERIPPHCADAVAAALRADRRADGPAARALGFAALVGGAIHKRTGISLLPSRFFCVFSISDFLFRMKRCKRWAFSTLSRRQS